MSGAIPPLPSTPSRRGTQLKHRDNFTFESEKFRILQNEELCDFYRLPSVIRTCYDVLEYRYICGNKEYMHIKYSRSLGRPKR
jgi:hypothetical protein